MKGLKKLFQRSAVVLVCLLLLYQIAPAAKSNFAQKGEIELGGSLGYMSSTPVYGGQTGTATSTIQLSPYFGYFISDGFELGVDPFSIVSISSGGSSMTQILFLIAPSYNFTTSGNIYPFVEGLIGYSSISGGGTTGSGLCWGLKGGIKINITGNGLLNFGLQYAQYTYTPSGSSDRVGSNNISLIGGFTIFFN
jgi:hypothetical protein